MGAVRPVMWVDRIRCLRVLLPDIPDGVERTRITVPSQAGFRNGIPAGKEAPVSPAFPQFRRSAAGDQPVIVIGTECIAERG